MIGGEDHRRLDVLRGFPARQRATWAKMRVSGSRNPGRKMRRAARAEQLRFQAGKSAEQLQRLAAGASSSPTHPGPAPPSAPRARATSAISSGTLRSILACLARRRCSFGDLVPLELAASLRCAEIRHRARSKRCGCADNRPVRALARRTISSASAPGSRISTACTRSVPITAESRTPGCWFSTRSTSSGKTLRPSGVTIISFLRPENDQLAVLLQLADVAGVEPAVLERPRGFFGTLEIAGRDVLAAHENLAVGRDLHLHAGDRLAHRSLARVERMIQRHDRARSRSGRSLE